MATIIIAKIIGIYMLVVGLAILAQPKRFKAMYKDMLKQTSLLFYGGIMALLFGAVIVSFHNVWVFSWPVFITILGWWGVIKGAGLLLWTDGFIDLFKPMMKLPENGFRIMGAIATLLGLFFTYQGWF